MPVEKPWQVQDLVCRHVGKFITEWEERRLCCSCERESEWLFGFDKLGKRPMKTAGSRWRDPLFQALRGNRHHQQGEADTDSQTNTLEVISHLLLFLTTTATVPPPLPPQESLD